MGSQRRPGCPNGRRRVRTLTGGGGATTKRDWFMFYGFMAVLIVVDVIGAGLANTGDTSKASTHPRASATASATLAAASSAADDAP